MEKNEIRFMSMTEMLVRESGIDLLKARTLVKETRVDRIDLEMMATILKIWLVRFRLNNDIIGKRSEERDEVDKVIR